MNTAINLGTGNGAFVKQVISAVRKVTGLKVRRKEAHPARYCTEPPSAAPLKPSSRMRGNGAGSASASRKFQVTEFKLQGSRVKT